MNTTKHTNIRSAWVLLINHKHGQNISVHATEEGAQQALHAYCRDWWDEGIIEQYGKPEDLSREEFIDAYFDCHEHCLDAEWYLLEEQQIED